MLSHKGLLEAGEEEISDAMEEAQKLSRENFGKQIRFYVPSFTYYKADRYCSSATAFPSISLTGSLCSLKCKHCGSVVLNTMYPADSPEKLVALCRELKHKGAVGCLISGGCSPDGSMPLEKFMRALATVKRDFRLTLVVHTGVVDESTAQGLKEAGIDAALIDIIGSEETIKEVCNLGVSVGSYDRSLKLLGKAGVPTVPHVLAGLHYGKLKGELRALEMISRYNPSAVIVIVFMPIHGTVMERIPPPPPMDVSRVLVAARLLMPSTPLALGCMRPKGVHRAETDVLALKAGVNAIAFPAREAISLAESLGYDATFSSVCCSQVFEDLKRDVVGLGGLL